jgi:hypothetical protein
MGWSTHDGSLGNGAECKTHPSTYEWLKRDDRLVTACESLISVGARSWAYDTCGLHAHVSLASFSRASAVYRFTWLQVSAFREQCQALAGRVGAAYAQWHGGYVQSPLRVISGKEGKRDRSVAVNVNDDTIELRYWKGCLTPSSVIGQCAFIDALVQYAPTFKDAEAVNKSVSWDAFGRWTQENLAPSQVHDIAQLCANRDVPFPVYRQAQKEV